MYILERVIGYKKGLSFIILDTTDSVTDQCSLGEVIKLIEMKVPIKGLVEQKDVCSLIDGEREVRVNFSISDSVRTSYGVETVENKYVVRVCRAEDKEHAKRITEVIVQTVNERSNTLTLLSKFIVDAKIVDICSVKGTESNVTVELEYTDKNKHYSRENVEQDFCMQLVINRKTEVCSLSKPKLCG